MSEVTVTKGKTVKIPDRDEWLKVEYTVKTVVESPKTVDSVRAEVERKIDEWLSSVPIAAPAPTTVPAEAEKAPAITIKELQQAFPEDLRKLLTFESEGDFIIVRPCGFLGSDRFAEIARIVKSYNGEYVSKGRESHFRVPRRG